MIEAEILDAIGDDNGDGSRLNAIADQFRNGREISEILRLLDSNNAELVSIGAWLLGELPFDFYASDEFVSRVRKLVEHPDSSVRFHALGALFPALDAQDDATRVLLCKLRHDPNEGVRMAAEATATRLGVP